MCIKSTSSQVERTPDTFLAMAMSLKQICTERPSVKISANIYNFKLEKYLHVQCPLFLPLLYLSLERMFSDIALF